jgi:imidazolonepropionase-like amidohydrolase
MESERSTGTFSRFLALAAERGISQETAISKVTSVPAKILGLQKRGVIAEGALADIAIFKDGKIQHVLISGIFAVRDGEVTHQKPGIIL